MKFCRNCQCEHPLDDMYADRRSPDGKANYCKRSRQLRLKMYYVRNPAAYNRAREGIVRSQRKLAPDYSEAKLLREALLKEDRRKLGKRAVRALLREGMSGEEIARRIGVGGRAVYGWKTGERPPHPQNLEALLALSSILDSDLMLRIYRERLASKRPILHSALRTAKKQKLDETTAKRRAAREQVDPVVQKWGILTPDQPA